MFALLPLFIVTFLVSFVASAQPGVVNLSVIQATLRQSRWAGLCLAAGGCLPELVYGGLVAVGSRWFEQVPGLQNTLRVIAVPALLLLGVLALLRARRPTLVVSGAEVLPTTTGRSSFFRGMTLAFLNPQLPLFWFFVLVYYSNYPWLRVSLPIQQATFALGASLGAFSILNLYVWLIHRRREQIGRYLQPQRFDLIMGCGFIGMALWRAAGLWL